MSGKKRTPPAAGPTPRWCGALAEPACGSPARPHHRVAGRDTRCQRLIPLGTDRRGPLAPPIIPMGGMGINLWHQVSKAPLDTRSLRSLLASLGCPMSPCRGQARNTKRPGQRLSPPTRGTHPTNTRSLASSGWVPHRLSQSPYPALRDSQKPLLPTQLESRPQKPRSDSDAPRVSRNRPGKTPVSTPEMDAPRVDPVFGLFSQVAHGVPEYRLTFSMSRPSGPERPRREAITRLRGSDPGSDRAPDHLGPRHPRTAARGVRVCLSAGANAYGVGWPRGGRHRDGTTAIHGGIGQARKRAGHPPPGSGSGRTGGRSGAVGGGPRPGWWTDLGPGAVNGPHGQCAARPSALVWGSSCRARPRPGRTHRAGSPRRAALKSITPVENSPPQDATWRLCRRQSEALSPPVGLCTRGFDAPSRRLRQPLGLCSEALRRRNRVAAKALPPSG